MFRIKVLVLPLIVFCGCIKLTAQESSLIPLPVSVTYQEGVKFRLKPTAKLGGNTQEAREVAVQLGDFLRRATGYSLSTGMKGDIQLNIHSVWDSVLGNEGYRLTVKRKRIVIDSNTGAGLFYGVQTLYQLFPEDIERGIVVGRTWDVPGCQVLDYPRFGWRGVMLDVSRHFFSVSEVKRYLDEIARYKYNVFHWHLTDDNGWRIEIKSLPRLTEVGGCRVQRFGKWGSYSAPGLDEKATDCGFYTQEMIREVVAYAAARYIKVLPEIDVPGHSSAAIAAYPSLCCTRDSSIRVSPGHDFSDWFSDGTFSMRIDNTLNPSDPYVYEFLDKVFSEVASLFPFEYIHMGGDECYHGYWQRDVGCRRLIDSLGISGYDGLQAYFVGRVNRIIREKGKKMIGWDEILDGGLTPDVGVMSWRGFKGGIEAVRLGHPVVMAPNEYVYIDLLQGEPTVEPDQTSYKWIRLKKAYSYEPVPEGLRDQFVLGGEINLWTEKVPTYRQMEYMSFPRAWALSDIYWSPRGSNDWDRFVPRMEAHMRRSDFAVRNYARSVYDPIVRSVMESDKLRVEVSTEIVPMEIYYTLDETMPDKFSRKYMGAVEIPPGDVTFKCQAFSNGKPVGKTIALSREQLIARIGLR
jgi:hexosaminidase